MRSGSLRRSGAALGATVALVGGVLAATPADAVSTHTVTVTVTPAQANWSVVLSCDTDASGNGDIGSTDSAGKVSFPNVPDGSNCDAQAAPFNYFTDPLVLIGFGGGGSSPYEGGSSGNPSPSAQLTVAMQPNTDFRCAGLSSVAGTPAVGQQLTAVAPGTVNGAGEDVARRSIVWMGVALRNGHLVGRVAQGFRAADPSHYTVGEADLGYQMVALVVSRENGNGDTAFCDWNPTGVVGRLGTPTPGRPGIAGKAVVGKKLTANPHAVPAGTTVTYQWFRSVGGSGHKARLVKIRRAHGKRYKLRGADRGHKVFVAVTYSRSPYNPTTVLSGGKKVH